MSINNHDDNHNHDDDHDDDNLEGNHSSCLKYDVSVPNASFPVIKRKMPLLISIDISLVAVMEKLTKWGRSARHDGRVNLYSSDLKSSAGNVTHPARFRSTRPRNVRVDGIFLDDPFLLNRYREKITNGQFFWYHFFCVTCKIFVRLCIIPATRVRRPRVILIFFHTPQSESPNSIQQNRLRGPPRHSSSGERNQRDCEYIPHRILLGLSGDTLFAATRRA